MRLFFIIGILVSFVFACKKAEINPEVLVMVPEAAGRGSSISLKGSGFGDKIENISVSFDNISVQPSFVSDSLIVVAVPFNATTGNVTLSVKGGDISSVAPKPFVVLPGIWKRISDMPMQGRSGSTGFILNNKIYFGTGSSNPTHFRDFWEFDPANGQWTQKADYPDMPVLFASGFALDNKGYMGLGKTENSQIRSGFFEYDPVSNTWKFASNLPVGPRSHGTTFTIGNRAFIAAQNDLVSYTAGSNNWQTLANIPGGPRVNAMSFALNGVGFLGLGILSGTFDRNLYRYDPTANTWTTATPFPGISTIWAVAAPIDNNRAFIRTLNECWLYESDRWTQIATPFGSSQGYETAFVVNNKVYLIGGFNFRSTVGTPGASAEVWELTL
jgi:N-acetylneuraminic acid mutarotase